MSEWFQYGCNEDAFNSLPAFLAGKIKGALPDSERQIRAFTKIAANADGTSGEKIYRFVQEKLVAKEG